METITINVDVPFKGCKDCPDLQIDSSCIYAYDKPYITSYFCTNAEMCERVKKIIEGER